MEVILHIYDVTNTGSVKTNNTILQINKIFKDGIGLGGIFHSAVQMSSLSFCRTEEAFLRMWLLQRYERRSLQPEYLLKVFGNEEWSFGYCEQGSGVFSCPPGKNPVYTYRESIVLGKTNDSIYSVNQILRELSREWPGDSYDLLSRNCNHFCDEFCERLGVPKLPAWINRFANAGDTAMEVAGNTALRFRQAKDEIVSASKVAYKFFSSVTSNMAVTAESPSNSNRGSPRFQAPWFKNLMSIGTKPPNSSELENQDEDTHPQQRQQSTGHIRQNSRDGHIWQNSRDGHIRQNSLDGLMRQNSRDEHIRQNSLDGDIRKNSLDGFIWKNSRDRDAHIRQHSLDGHIQQNSLDGHIRQKSPEGHLRQNSRDDI